MKTATEAPTPDDLIAVAEKLVQPLADVIAAWATAAEKREEVRLKRMQLESRVFESSANAVDKLLAVMSEREAMWASFLQSNQDRSARELDTLRHQLATERTARLELERLELERLLAKSREGEP